jgi:ABC-2 type transport system permease protein
MKSPNDVNQIFKEGNASLALIFGNNFENEILRGNASIQLIADASEPNQATAQATYSTAIISENMAKSNLLPVTINSQLLYNPQMKGAYNFVPGILGVILMLICAMMTSISIVREKEMGTMEVLLASPIRPIYIIIAKVIPYLVLSLVNMTTILLLSVYLLGIPIAGNLLTLILFTFLFIIVALSLGMLISNIVNSQIAAMLISGMILMMPSMILSGMIFPIESMPKILQWFSTILPVRWYISGTRKLMIQGVDFQFIAQETIILAAMAALFLFISLKKFKVRLK